MRPHDYRAEPDSVHTPDNPALVVVSLQPSLAVKDLVTPKPGENGNDALARAGKLLTPEPKKKSRYRKLPRQIAAIVALKAEDPTMTTVEIADRLGMTPVAIRKMLYRARKEFKFNDVADSLNHQAIPQALENLNKGLQDRDKDYTLATLKGVGIFRNHSAVKQEGVGSQTNVLKIEIQMPEMPPGAQVPVVAIGSVLSTPRRARLDAGPDSEGAQAQTVGMDVPDSGMPVIDAETVDVNG